MQVEKAATDLLKDTLKNSCTERFLLTTMLNKIGQMMANVKITHQSDIDVLELEKIKPICKEMGLD